MISEQLPEGSALPAADIEYSMRARIGFDGTKHLDQVLDMEVIANHPAIAPNAYFESAHRAIHEVCDRPEGPVPILIFAVWVSHAQDEALESRNAFEHLQVHLRCGLLNSVRRNRVSG